MDDFIEIDILRLVNALLEKWRIILISLIWGIYFAFIYTQYLVVPMYRTNISVYVKNSSNDAVKSDTINTSDLTASQRLVNTYVTIIRSDSVLDQVSKNIEYICTSDDIRSMMSSEAVKDTEIFNVFIDNNNATLATLIANELANVITYEIPNFLNGSSVKILDYAKIPIEPYTPVLYQNLLIGMFIGCFISILVLSLIYFFDKRIKTEKDLEHLTDIPILGYIPDFNSSTKNGYYYEYATGINQGPDETKK